MFFRKSQNKSPQIVAVTVLIIFVMVFFLNTGTIFAEEITCGYFEYQVLNETQIEISGLSDEGRSYILENKSITVPAELDGYAVKGIGTSGLSEQEIQYVLESVTISEGIQYISDLAFYGLEKLHEVNLPTTLQKIGYGSFGGCTSLATISLPKKLKSLGDRCFQTSGIQTIILPESLETIGEYCFYNSSLKNVIFPEYAEITMSENSFALCDNLETVTLSEGITEISNRCFRQCTNLKSITFPSTLTTIGEYAFLQCSSLDNVLIPYNVTTLKLNAFRYCTSLSTIVISENVKNFGGAVFWGTPWFAAKRAEREDHLVVVNNILIDGRLCSGDVQIPEGVQGIGQYAFYGSEDNMATENLSGATITSVTLPDSVVKIDSKAFYKCSNLTKVTLPRNLEVLETKAFSGCDKLTLTVPETLPNLEKIQFSDMPEVTFCIAKEGKVYRYLVQNNIVINYVTYEYSDTEEDDGQNGGADNAENEKDENADSSDNDVTENTNSAGNNTTDNATLSEEKKIVYKVGNTYTVKKLKYKILSKNKVTFLGAADKKITSLTIPATVKLGTKKYKVTSISKKACKGYKKLKKVVIGDNVSKIGDEAFMNCKVLKTVTLGKGITEIGKKAYYKDTKMEKLNIKSKKLKKVGKNAFYKIKHMKVVVPKHKNNKYKKEYTKLIMRCYVLGYMPKKN